MKTATHLPLCWKPLQTFPRLQKSIISTKITIELRWVTNIHEERKMKQQILENCFLMFQFYGHWVTVQLTHVTWIVGVSKLRNKVNVGLIFPETYSWDTGLEMYA